MSAWPGWIKPMRFPCQLSCYGNTYKATDQGEFDIIVRALERGDLAVARPFLVKSRVRRKWSRNKDMMAWVDRFKARRAAARF